ncbi:hypothetical protein NM688_g3214 [Phlebia brevispora]|uniref:Uncharacterized protein n=1 Tax=Phlebia brevispora TaxID=194682 RepID=A0ACC1T727_9APHY|nr:hypothetical protein NM688_g3214 [Phlebia brevispora]
MEENPDTSWSANHEGYCGGIEAGILTDIFVRNFLDLHPYYVKPAHFHEQRHFYHAKLEANRAPAIQIPLFVLFLRRAPVQDPVLDTHVSTPIVASSPLMDCISTYASMRVDPQTFAQSADEVGLVWVEPVPELITGDIKKYAITNGVVPSRVAGYWYGDSAPPSPDEKIIYEVHGGAFVFGDASPVSYLGNAGLCKEMLRHNQEFSKAFQIEYRLSQGPPLPHENPFPAALIDAVAGYHYLVKVMGYKPSNILLMGESAGGGLAISLVRYLITYVPSLPPPAAVLLMAPFVDGSTTHSGPESSFTMNMRSDFIHPFFTGYCLRALLGALPLSEADTNPWLSPVSGYLQETSGWFAGFPPTFLIFGEAELIRDANRTLAERMGADMGERFTYLEILDATHIFMNFTWHEPERTEGLKQVAKWLSVTM